MTSAHSNLSPRPRKRSSSSPANTQNTGKRSHGRPVDGLSAHHFINFLQNHDQIGNRAFGDRIHETVGIDKMKVALGLCSPLP